MGNQNTNFKNPTASAVGVCQSPRIERYPTFLIRLYFFLYILYRQMYICYNAIYIQGGTPNESLERNRTLSSVQC